MLLKGDSAMLELLKDFWFTNWVNVLLIMVGVSAIVLYVVQERRRKTEAASLLVLQIDELLDRIRAIST